MDYQIDHETGCCHCPNEVTHFRKCSNFNCEDGRENLHDEDPINFGPNETMICQDCGGTGVEHWCPECGEDQN